VHSTLQFPTDNLPITHNSEINLISSVEWKDVIFDRKIIFVFLKNLEKEAVLRNEFKKTVKIEIKPMETSLSMLLESLYKSKDVFS